VERLDSIGKDLVIVQKANVTALDMKTTSQSVHRCEQKGMKFQVGSLYDSEDTSR
jgi:hypothetical protein